MIQTAITKKMSLYCLTEHMPRQLPDLYPEEVAFLGGGGGGGGDDGGGGLG